MAGSRTGSTRLNPQLLKKREDRVKEAILNCDHKFVDGDCVLCGVLE